MGDVCCDDIYSSSDEDPLLETEDTEVKPSDKMPFGPFKKAAEEKRLKEEEEKKKAEEEERLEEEEKLADKQEKASIADSGIDSPDYIEKQDTNFDMELKKNPIYDDDTKVKPVLCCCIQ